MLTSNSLLISLTPLYLWSSSSGTKRAPSVGLDQLVILQRIVQVGEESV
jgi:hypothetical protein